MSKNWLKFCILLLLVLTAIQIVHASDNNSDNWYKEGNRLLELGNYQEAITAYDKALSIDPNYTYAWNNKGEAFYNLKKYYEADDAYAQAVQLDRNYTKAWDNKGKVLIELASASDDKNYKELFYKYALDSYNRALKLDPNDAVAWNGKGNALNSLGRYNEALAALNKALSLDPNYEEAWNHKGETFERLGKYQEAIATYDKALSINPNSTIVKKNKETALLLISPAATLVSVFCTLFLLSAIISFIYMIYKWVKSKQTLALLFNQQKNQQSLKYAEYNKIVSLAILFDLSLSGSFLFVIIWNGFYFFHERGFFDYFFSIMITINVVICLLFLIKWREKPEMIGKKLWLVKILFSLLGIITAVSAVIFIIIHFSNLRKNQIQMIMQEDR